MQKLVIRLIQEEFTLLLSLPTNLPESVWNRAIALVDPTLLYCTAAEPTIRICPESYEQLRAGLPRELIRAE
ncbi:hypothetical protein GCM10027346_41350 [Hymenobacter seoulensis]